MLKFFVKCGMIFDKVFEIISYKQSKYLEKCIPFNTQKRNQAVNHFEKDHYKLLNNAFYAKSMENFLKRCEKDFINKDDTVKFIKHQSKLTFSGVHKSFSDLKNLEDSFEFNNLNKDHGLFRNKNKKLIAKIKIGTPKNVWIDDFVFF